MKFAFSALLLLPLTAFAQTPSPSTGNQLPLNGVFSEQHRPPAHTEPARHEPSRSEPSRHEPAHPQQPIHRPAPVHPGPGPAHHGPEREHNKPGPHGEWHPHPGWHTGWHHDRNWHPGWFHVGIAFAPFVWLGDVPAGYWQCTAFNQNMQAFSAMGPDQDQAAFGALTDCGGANYEAAGCYVPDNYCEAR